MSVTMLVMAGTSSVSAAIRRCVPNSSSLRKGTPRIWRHKRVRRSNSAPWPKRTSSTSEQIRVSGTIRHSAMKPHSSVGVRGPSCRSFALIKASSPVLLTPLTMPATSATRTMVRE